MGGFSGLKGARATSAARSRRPAPNAVSRGSGPLPAACWTHLRHSKKLERRVDSRAGSSYFDVRSRHDDETVINKASWRCTSIPLYHSLRRFDAEPPFHGGQVLSPKSSRFDSRRQGRARLVQPSRGEETAGLRRWLLLHVRPHGPGPDFARMLKSARTAGGQIKRLCDLRRTFWIEIDDPVDAEGLGRSPCRAGRCVWWFGGRLRGRRGRCTGRWRSRGA
jgi:hypothetical protein